MVNLDLILSAYLDIRLSITNFYMDVLNECSMESLLIINKILQKMKKIVINVSTFQWWMTSFDLKCCFPRFVAFVDGVWILCQFIEEYSPLI